MAKTKKTNNHGVPLDLPRTREEMAEEIQKEMEQRYKNKMKDKQYD